MTRITTLSFSFFMAIPAMAFAHGGEEAAKAATSAMSPLFAYTLVGHIMFGLVGVMALYAVWMGLLKKNIGLSFLRWSSFTAFVSLLASWVTGGIYYVGFYGGTVKPLIKAGEYAWAHSLITETKEHVFLVMPFLAFVLFIILLLEGERVKSDSSLKRGLSYIAGIAAILGILITLAGVIISGATS